MVQAETRIQIDRLELSPERPLLVCDVDEVVFHFIRGMEQLLATEGLWLDPASYALEGNIRKLDDNEPVSGARVARLVGDFFKTRAHNLEPIENAVECLNRLSEKMQIVMLSNLPHSGRDARVQNQKKHGIPFALISNDGPKGPAVKYMTRQLSAPLFFADDIHDNINSVGEFCPNAYLIHFLQDRRFAVHAQKAKRADLITDNWLDTESFINKMLTNGGRG